METDARSDIYSLGMVLYELLTGRVPFAGDSEYELMRAQVEQLPTPPREFAPDIPEEVEWAILCATEKDPVNRFQTAGAFSSAIVDCVKTAIATGRLSQIEMTRPTGRLNASAAVTDLLRSRPSTASHPGLSQSTAAMHSDTPQSSAETPRVPSQTRIAGEREFAALASEQSRDGVKMTRMAQIADVQSVARNDVYGPMAHQPAPPSIWSKLNWKHYLGAATAGVLLLVILTLPVTMFLKSRAAATSTAQPPLKVPSPVEPTNPVSIPDPESTDNSQSHTSTDSIREQSSLKDEPVKDSQDSTPVSSDAQKTRKIVKPNTRVQAKPRRGAKDIMEGP